MSESSCMWVRFTSLQILSTSVYPVLTRASTWQHKQVFLFGTPNHQVVINDACAERMIIKSVKLFFNSTIHSPISKTVVPQTRDLIEARAIKRGFANMEDDQHRRLTVMACVVFNNDKKGANKKKGEVLAQKAV